jgi:hypothetical protein
LKARTCRGRRQVATAAVVPADPVRRDVLVGGIVSRIPIAHDPRSLLLAEFGEELL